MFILYGNAFVPYYDIIMEMSARSQSVHDVNRERVSVGFHRDGDGLS